jgi:transposase
MGRMASVEPTPDSEAEARTLCAMKLRVYPTGPQAGRLGHWIYCAHRFRNEATIWLKAWRVERAIWFAQHPESKGLKGEALKALLPPHLAVNPVNACSAWLTGRLQQARGVVPLELGLQAEERAMRGLGEAVGSRLRHLTRLEQEEVTDAWLLTVPRTVFDQVLQDVKKSWSKALKDRQEKLKKPAGFPKPRKRFRYPGSIRVQLVAEKNQAVRDHWAQGEIFVPGLGVLPFRDSGYVLPKTAPSLFTLGRDAAGRVYATFVCVEGEGPWAGDGTLCRKARLERKRNQERVVRHARNCSESELRPLAGKTSGAASRSQAAGVLGPSVSPIMGQPFAPLPLDSATGLPKVDAIDLGLTDRAVTASGHKSGRVRHLKQHANRLRRLDRKLSRQQRGSKRWQKTKIARGRTHTKVVFQRDALLTEQAQSLVAENAILCLETLFLAFLMKNRRLAQSAADAALGKFQKKLELEAAKRGHLILRCDRFDASSKTCSVCKTKNPELKLRHRVWVCKECGSTHDRDVNAATNVQEMALERAISQLSTVPESGIGARLPTGLHPDLAAFVARGGLTALLGQRSSESRAVEACVLPQDTSFILSGTG